MDTYPTTPQMAFAQFVRQAVDDAREEHGWTVGDIAHHTGVSRSTLFRWLAGDWQRYPELAKVRSLCATLGLSIAAAIRPLAMPNAAVTPRALAEVEADMGSIRRRLLDDAVPAADKRQIRELLRRLAGRDLPVEAASPSTSGATPPSPSQAGASRR
ncbi:helix-turn-helix transcriptional regulator [Micromonospora lupini]|nr:helix-turn-helix transcriptional regulator [Micromonospora lupini]